MFLIVSGGYPPKLKDLRECASASEMIIAADKGAQYCLDAEIVPDIVIGDMDSLPRKARLQLEKIGVDMVAYSPDKDKTDTQLALECAIKKGAKEIVILSGIGDRIDHSIANIHLLKKALSSGIDAQLLDPKHKIFLIRSEYCIEKMKGKTVSFLPLTPKAEGIFLKGFRYTLKSATMTLGFPCGVSNVITSDKATVKVSNGILVGVLLR
jgi:thiamine pyrophosphokinase